MPSVLSPNFVVLNQNLGAFQLLQLQEDVRRQFKVDGSVPEKDVESHIRQNKDTLMSSLWKLNVVDIEVTLLHVCQLVRSFLFRCLEFDKQGCNSTSLKV